MKRIALTSENGAWFDAEKAELYKEDKWWNGNNWISSATGSQFEHEAIYITKSGKFILNSWSDFQGSQESYELITKEDAARWFAKQGFGDDEIPDVFAKEVASLEIE